MPPDRSAGPLGEGVPSIPEFRPVAPDIFERRAERLLALALGHAMEGYLRFTAALARGQAEQLHACSALGEPDLDASSRSARRRPPLSVESHVRDPSWRRVLVRLLDALNLDAMPARAARVVESLRRAEDAALEQEAARVLAGSTAEVDPGRAPFVAAALQVYWVSLALSLPETTIGSNAGYGRCPVCGSPPVVSVVRSGGAAQGLRYLVCSLCGSEWHVVRIKCTACASTTRVSYLYIEAATDAVKAECCDECRTYLKILYQDKDARLDPYADDLATLALDMLVDEEGYNRRGPNLLFSPGVGVGS